MVWYCSELFVSRVLFCFIVLIILWLYFIGLGVSFYKVWFWLTLYCCLVCVGWFYDDSLRALLFVLMGLFVGGGCLLCSLCCLWSLLVWYFIQIVTCCLCLVVLFCWSVFVVVRLWLLVVYLIWLYRVLLLWCLVYWLFVLWLVVIWLFSRMHWCFCLCCDWCLFCTLGCFVRVCIFVF